jgi:hypothetical protein
MENPSPKSRRYRNEVTRIYDGNIAIAETTGENSLENAEKIVAALELWDNHCQNTARAALIMGGF